MTSINFQNNLDSEGIRHTRVPATMLGLQKEGVPLAILMPVASELVRRSGNEGLSPDAPLTLQVQSKLARNGENYGGTTRHTAGLLAKWLAGRTLGLEIDPPGWFPVSFLGDPTTLDGRSSLYVSSLTASSLYVSSLTARSLPTPQKCLLHLLKQIAPEASMTWACMMATPQIQYLDTDVYGNAISQTWMQLVSYDLTRPVFLETMAEYLKSFGWKPTEGYKRAKLTYPAFPTVLTPELAYVIQFLSASTEFRAIPPQWQFDIAAASLLSRFTAVSSRSWYTWAGEVGDARHQNLAQSSLYGLLDSLVLYSYTPLPDVWPKVSEIFGNASTRAFFETYTGVQDFYNKIKDAFEAGDGSNTQEVKDNYRELFGTSITTEEMESICTPQTQGGFYAL